MPNLFLADMVREMSSSTGTGAFSLDGPTPGHRSFAAALPSGATFPYAICGVSDESQWETGEGTLSPSGQLLRSPKASSAGGALVDFGEGLKTVALTLTADWAGGVQSDASAPVTIGAVAGLTAALDGKVAVSSAAQTNLAATDRLLARAGNGATVDVPADAIARRLENGSYHAPASLGIKETAPVGDVHISNPAGTVLTLSSGVFTNDHAARIQYRNRQGASGQPAEGQIGAEIRFARLGTSANYRITFGTTTGSSGTVTDRWYIAENGHLRPAADASYNIGAAGERVGTIFASNGTISTSDAAMKADIGPIPDEWLDAWGRVEWRRFRFKGGARWHVGLIAQAVEAAFAAEGVDAFEIGLLCRDSVDGPDGAKARYGLRYDECFALEAAWVRRELARKSDKGSRRRDA